MCKHCIGVNKFQNEDLLKIDNKHIAYLYYWGEDDYSLCVDFNGVEFSSISMPVNYCPVCGAKLNSERRSV